MVPRRSPRTTFRRAQRERDDFFADDFRAEDFRAEDFFAPDFFAVERVRVDVLALDFLALDRFVLDRFVLDFLALDRFALDFLALDFFADDFLADDFFAAARFEPPRFAAPRFAAPRVDGTFAPSSRASESPIAIACSRLVTLPPRPPRPRFSVPDFRFAIARFTDLPAALPYFRPPDRFVAAMSPPRSGYGASGAELRPGGKGRASGAVSRGA
jgi:hypothetical protein